MKNHNPMFYGKFIYALKRRTTPSATPEVKKGPEAQLDSSVKRVLRGLQLVQKHRQVSRKEKEVCKNQANIITVLHNQFKSEIKDKKPDAITLIAKKYTVKIRSALLKALEIITVRQTAGEIKTKIDKQYTAANAEMMKLYDQLPAKVKKYTKKKHVQMLVDAYLIRWKNQHKDYVTKLITYPGKSTTDYIVKLGKTIDTDNNPLAPQLEKYKKAINLAMNVWKKPDSKEWRKVYAKENWDTKYQAKAKAYAAKEAAKVGVGTSDRLVAKYKLAYNKAMEKYRQKNPPPLPDGDAKYQKKVDVYARAKALKAANEELKKEEGFVPYYTFAQIGHKKPEYKIYLKVLDQAKKAYRDKHPPLTVG